MKMFLLFLFSSPFLMFGQEKFVKKLEKELSRDLVRLNQESSATLGTSNITPIWSRTLDSTQIGEKCGFEFVDTSGIYETSNPIATYITSSCITKREFIEFRTWIRDSIAREMIYYSFDDSRWAIQWIDYEKEYYSEPDQKNVKFDPSDRDINREVFPLNWKRKLDYNDERIVPFLADLYVPEPFRFRRSRVFDYRKMSHHFENKQRHSAFQWRFPVYIDEFGMARNSTSYFDELSVLSFLYSDVNLDTPVSFIEPFMAKAYCWWKSEQLNQKLKSKAFSIVCRLPNEKEIGVFKQVPGLTQQLSAFDYTDQWKITNSEFKEFSISVRDSLCREWLYNKVDDNELALSLLNYQNYYFSPSALEFVDIDITDRQVNREFFNWSNDEVKWEKFGYTDATDVQQELKLDSLVFDYEWMDCKSRGVQGVLYREEPKRSWLLDKWPLSLSSEDADAHGEPTGQDLRLDGYIYQEDERHRYYGFGTRSHANLQRFIKREKVFIPIPQEIAENEELADISYDQAIAYYNWKYRIDKYQKGDDWRQFVFPTEEEFNRIKNGESIVHPEKIIEFDEPVFRMVVEIVENKE